MIGHRFTLRTVLFAVALVAPLVILAGPPGTLSGTKDASAPSPEELRSRNALIIEKAARESELAHKKNMELIAREEIAMTRQERNIDRYEKILARWERQQAQFQKYLASLGTRAP